MSAWGSLPNLYAQRSFQEEAPLSPACAALSPVSAPLSPVCRCGDVMAFCGSSRNDGWSCDGATALGKCASGITGFYQTAGMNRYSCHPCGFDLCEGCAAICTMDKALCKGGAPPAAVGSGGECAMLPTAQVEQLRSLHAERCRTLQALRHRLRESSNLAQGSNLAQSIRARLGETDRVRDEKTRACVKLREVMVTRRTEIAELLADIGKLTAQERMASDREQKLQGQLRESKPEQAPVPAHASPAGPGVDAGASGASVGYFVAASSTPALEGQAAVDGAEGADLKKQLETAQERLQQLLKEKEDTKVAHEGQLKELRAEKQRTQEKLALALLKQKTGPAPADGAEATELKRQLDAAQERQQELLKEKEDTRVAHEGQLKELRTEKQRVQEKLALVLLKEKTGGGAASAMSGELTRMRDEMAKLEEDVAEARAKATLLEEQRDTERERHKKELLDAQVAAGEAAAGGDAASAMSEELARMRGEIAKLEEAVAEAKAKASLLEEEKEAEKQRQTEALELVSGDAGVAAAALEASEAEKKRLAEEAVTLQEEKKRLEANLAELQGDAAGEASAKSLEVERIGQENATLQAKIQEMHAHQEKERERHAQQLKDLREQGDQAAALEAEKQSIQAELEGARMEASSILQDLETLRGKADATAAELEQLRAENARLADSERSMSQTLDSMRSHGFYLVPDGVKGLGLSADFLPNGRVMVGSVTPGSWAAQNGILPDAMVVSIGHKLAHGMAKSEMQDYTKDRPLCLHILAPKHVPEPSAPGRATAIAGHAAKDAAASSAAGSSSGNAPFRRVSAAVPGGRLTTTVRASASGAHLANGNTVTATATAAASAQGAQGAQLNKLDAWYMQYDPSEHPGTP